MLHYTEEYLCDLCEASTSHLDLEKLASKKVLVTGASGLICSALVDQLLIWNKMHKQGNQMYSQINTVEDCKKFKELYGK